MIDYDWMLPREMQKTNEDLKSARASNKPFKAFLESLMLSINDLKAIKNNWEYTFIEDRFLSLGGSTTDIIKLYSQYNIARVDKFNHSPIRK